MKVLFLRIFAILMIVIVNVGCDQVSKNVVRQKINYYEAIHLIDNHLTLTKVENSGAFLSLGDSLPEPIKLILLSALPVLALAFGFVFLFTKTNLSRLTITGISCVIGGGIGNLYDRIVHGSVTDFLHINFGIFQTGIFNMADVSIMAGVFLLLISSYLTRTNGQNVSSE